MSNQSPAIQCRNCGRDFSNQQIDFFLNERGINPQHLATDDVWLYCDECSLVRSNQKPWVKSILSAIKNAAGAAIRKDSASGGR